MADEEDKKNDEEKDLELDIMAETELLRLTRQFRFVRLFQKIVFFLWEFKYFANPPSLLFGCHRSLESDQPIGETVH